MHQQNQETQPAVAQPLTREDLAEILAGAFSRLKSEIKSEIRAEAGDRLHYAGGITLAERQREETLERREEAMLKKRAEVDAALRAGPKQFSVSLHGNPTRVVGAESEFEAQARYASYFGIIRTDHPYEISEVTSEVAADAQPVAA